MNKNIPEKINILFVIMQMGMGGTERLVHSLILKMNREVFNPFLAWFKGEEINEEFLRLNIPLFYIPKMRRFDLSAMRMLGKIVQNNNIHIVNAHHFMPFVYSFYGCKIVNRKKLICILHSEWEIENIPWRWQKIGNALLKYTDGIGGISPAVLRSIEGKFNINHSKTKRFSIQNGVDYDNYQKGKNKNYFKEKIGIGMHDNVIGIVANFKRVKNHIFLLKTFHELLKVKKNTRLLLIGQGFIDDPDNTEQDIRRIIYEKGMEKEVLLLGYRSDIPDVLNAMDIFCLISFKEGLPISLIEAMAAGLPVVGTDVDGIRDVIVHGENGYLVKNNDVENLRDVLLSLLDNESLREKFGTKSRSLAKEHYSLERCVREYEDLFLSFAQRKSNALSLS